MSGASSREPSGGRRIVILRHGQTEHNAAGIWQGQLDARLSERGLRQAAAVAPALAALEPVRVVSSDLSRARVTGQHVADAAGLPLELDERLREVYAADWQGLTSAQVQERWPQEWAAVLRGEDVPRGGPQGETMADVRERTGAALTDILAGMEAGQRVVVSTHGAAGRTAAAWLLGLETQTAWRVLAGLGNCHWSELVEGREGWRIQVWNASVSVLSGATAGPASAPP